MTHKGHDTHFFAYYKTKKLQLGCSLLLVSGVGQNCAKAYESGRRADFNFLWRPTAVRSPMLILQVGICNTVILQKQFWTRKCLHLKILLCLLLEIPV